MATYDSSTAIADIPGAPYDALKVRFAELAPVVDAVGAERKALNDEIKRREKEARMRSRLGSLLSEEHNAILRAIVNSPEFSR